VSHYWRQFHNYLDDDVFLNTGLSFPITFEGARIQGTEVRVEMPGWHNLSGFLSYANMLGRANSPVTGGLFVEGGDAIDLRVPGLVFPITQDQRNTAAAQLRWQIHPRIWVMSETHYGSGLPVELEDDDEPQQEAIPQSILNDVNFERGRVRPNFTLDLAVGTRIWQQHERSASLQLSVRNISDRLNVINFSGVFSGTALAPGRQISLQLKTRF
jgi:outer membrane receptor for Fe3+-dicitrate